MILLLRSLRTILALCLVMGFSVVVKAENHPVPDKYVYCTVCHGTLFRGNVATEAPKLTGLSSWYIAGQLESFQKGLRGKHGDDLAGIEMRPMAEVLTSTELNEVSKLISELPVPTSERAAGEFSMSGLTGNVGRGKNLYSSCAACHGVKGEGNKLLSAPNLAVQSDWYLALQLDNYRSKIRGNDPGDMQGLIMQTSASILKTDQDVLDVVAYIKSL